jgi:hypothetical protein
MARIIIVNDEEFVGEASRTRFNFLGAWIAGVKARD